MAGLFSGAVASSDTKTWLITTNGLIHVAEVTFGGSSIAGVRGAYSLGGSANPSVLNAGSLPLKVLLMPTRGAGSVSEVLDPS